ncbi:MAG: hypothetical protein OER90_00190 [Gemmatimonadota bacterium]|nr:hypothetical protein [Gemmatimonadota bacterium]
MTAIPTRWRTALHDQLQSALERSATARRHLVAEDGSAAIQEAYPAAIAGATIRAWQDARPWEQSLSAAEMHRRICHQLPSLFATLTKGDVQRALTSPWRVEEARSYVEEVEKFVGDTKRLVEHWLESP